MRFLYKRYMYYHTKPENACRALYFRYNTNGRSKFYRTASFRIFFFHRNTIIFQYCESINSDNTAIPSVYVESFNAINYCTEICKEIFCVKLRNGKSYQIHIDTSAVMLIAVNSLRPSDGIFRHRSGSTLARVMACCLTAPSHYLNQCWLNIIKVLWHSSDGNFIIKRYLSHHSVKLVWKLPS